MSDPDASIQDFWGYCVSCGITSKHLAIRRTTTTTTAVRGTCQRPCLSPISVLAEEKIRYGAPVISVPYTSVWNGQNLRGGLVPAGVPPFDILVRFLRLRRHHLMISDITAQSLWLACCLAGYRWGCRQQQQAAEQVNNCFERKAALLTSSSSAALSTRRLPPPPWCHFSPLLSPTFQYPLPGSPFEAGNAVHYPALRRAYTTPEELGEWRELTQRHLRLTHGALQHYARRRGISRRHTPSLDFLTSAYYTVLYRSILLPLHGEPSAPGDLNELLKAIPDMPLLPSLIPLVEHIRAVTVMEEGEEGKDGEETGVEANCTLYTSTQSEFVSLHSRRRVLQPPTSAGPLSLRRVVVCAARDIQVGEELTLGF